MYTLPKPLFVRQELLRRSVRVFTPLEFSRIFGTRSYQTKYFFERGVKSGLFLQLKRGLYTLKTDLPSEEQIANRLYQPSYISFEYALAYHNILPEMAYQVTSATTKSTRTFTINGKAFLYQKVKISAYTGYRLAQKGGSCFLIAEPEKALVDYLYFVVLGKKPYNERFNLSMLDKKKLRKYAKLYERSALIKFIEKKLP